MRNIQQKRISDILEAIGDF